MFRNTYVRESRFSTVKQVNFKNRNRMADETTDQDLQTALSEGHISCYTTVR